MLRLCSLQFIRQFACFVAGLACFALVHAENPAGKSNYSFANPTPDSQLRELVTDRPDVTESPFTVDAGRIQLEMDLINHTENHLDGVRTNEWGAAAFNLRLGVLSNLEAGIFVAPYVRRSERPRGGPSETHAGFGDITLRGKFNFAGNDGGTLAYGLIVDLKLPTARRELGNNAVEGTVFFPVDFKLARDWEVGAMTAVNVRQSDFTGGRRGVWINTITVGHPLAGKLGGYVELTSEAGDGSHVATFDTGLTLGLGPNAQVDAGVQLGLSRNADDAVFFVGLARRY